MREKLIEEALKELIILVDTREADAYKFKNTGIVFTTLKVGDYSVKGFQNEVSIERKTFGDFLGSITRGRERFIKELELMAEYERKAVVIETGYNNIVEGNHPYSKVKPQSSIGNIVKIMVDYGIPVVFAGNRQWAEDITLKFLQRFYLRKRGIK